MKDRVWWARPGFLAAGAFLLLVAILAIWIATSRTTSDATAPTTTTPGPPSQAGDGSPQTQPSSATTSTGDTPDVRVPDQAPADVAWTLWNGIALPSSPAAGPANVHDGLAEGYAHTPEGALVAATQIMYRVSGAKGRDVVERQVLAGAGRDRMLADMPTASTTPAPQLAGFKYTSYTGDRADIELVLKTADAQLGTLVVAMVWDDGDWRLMPTLQGQGATGYRYIPTMAGYVTWAGVQQ